MGDTPAVDGANYGIKPCPQTFYRQAYICGACLYIWFLHGSCLYIGFLRGAGLYIRFRRRDICGSPLNAAPRGAQRVVENYFVININCFIRRRLIKISGLAVESWEGVNCLDDLIDLNQGRIDCDDRRWSAAGSRL